MDMPEPSAGTKKKLRNNIAILKKSHAPEDLLQKSSQIKKLLFETQEFKNSKTILFYASIEGEVQTGEMIEQALKSGKKVLLPKVSGERLLLYTISGLGDLEKGVMGLAEPKQGLPELLIPQVDLIILPGIAFDKKGNRLGRGKGYYDRLLSVTNAPKIALAFHFQLLDEVPTGPQDQKVNKIITEKGAIECRQ